MITYEFARSEVLKHISRGIIFPEDDYPVILDDDSIELSWGWIFYYNGSKHLSTKDPYYAWIGNVPLMYDKIKQSIEFIWEAGTRIEDNIREYGIENGYIDDDNTKHGNTQ